MSLTAVRAVLVLLPLASMGIEDVHAQRREGTEDRGETRELSDTVRRVERETRGEVLSAERVPFDGRNVHRVKVLEASGRVRVYMDDPRPAPRRGASARTRDDDD